MAESCDASGLRRISAKESSSPAWQVCKSVCQCRCLSCSTTHPNKASFMHDHCDGTLPMLWPSFDGLTYVGSFRKRCRLPTSTPSPIHSTDSVLALRDTHGMCCCSICWQLLAEAAWPGLHAVYVVQFRLCSLASINDVGRHSLRSHVHVSVTCPGNPAISKRSVQDYQNSSH